MQTYSPVTYLQVILSAVGLGKKVFFLSIQDNMVD
jgi:hypothetical protein